MHPPLKLSFSPRGTYPLTPPRTARNSRPLEVIGTYDPIPKKDPYDTTGRLHKDIKLDTTRAKYWIGVGAHPTDTVWRLLSMVGTRHPPTLWVQQANILSARSVSSRPSTDQGLRAPPRPKVKRTRHSERDTARQNKLYFISHHISCVRNHREHVQRRFCEVGHGLYDRDESTAGLYSEQRSRLAGGSTELNILCLGHASMTVRWIHRRLGILGLG